ncbi:hypothetical protein [Granulicella tundricola]|uniref:Uncharacterized protein n=1 Tax=Granulicella tundricola (strain ATCC BAA-1859 / DSM 23138 / MP5ACTX9) TaxID=1198114 RepID=E8WXB0_GRATM|nr:hypothetical protein [Granulicella tundricola]ADW67443.1 hypothetical protein AciX9_0371 [Granulicella tundricola MP5ACTX9]
MAMKTGPKVALGSLLLLFVAAGAEVAWIHHRNHADDAPVAKAEYKSDPDDLVFLKKEHPDSLKDAKDLKGRTLWVSAGGQMDYFPYTGHKVDFAKSEGVLLGAEKLEVKDAIEAVAPKKTAFRIPAGDKQVLLVFTKAGAPTEYAVPVGYHEDGRYNFMTDEIFFYDDPHQLFNYWKPEIWAGIDAHKAVPGMNERQAEMALGQVVTPHGDTPGDRTMDFYNEGHPVTITFVHGKATTITPGA